MHVGARGSRTVYTGCRPADAGSTPAPAHTGEYRLSGNTGNGSNSRSGPLRRWQGPDVFRRIRVSSVTRPALRYHGGKWRIAPWIISHFPEHRVYVEPFGGAASVLLRKPRSYAEVYNDLDSEIVNVFRVLRDPTSAARLRDLCYLTPWARDEFWLSYEPTPDPVELARRTIARSYMSHGTTSMRKNRTGFRAKCYRQRQAASIDWSKWPEAIPQFVERLRGVVIENRPATEVIAQHDDENVLFYCDPPYPISTRSSIRGDWEINRAYRHDMTDDHHRELAEVLRSVRGMVIISGYSCALYDELYHDWRKAERQTLADGAAVRTEVLWISPNVSVREPDLFTGEAV
jgi:DNA adenine methylase